MGYTSSDVSLGWAVILSWRKIHVRRKVSTPKAARGYAAKVASRFVSRFTMRLSLRRIIALERPH